MVSLEILLALAAAQELYTTLALPIPDHLHSHVPSWVAP